MTAKNIHGLQAIDSREVAEKVEKKHAHLLRDIAGYIKIMDSVVLSAKLRPVSSSSRAPIRTARGENFPATLLPKRAAT